MGAGRTRGGEVQSSGLCSSSPHTHDPPDHRVGERAGGLKSLRPVPLSTCPLVYHLKTGLLNFILRGFE